MRDVTLYPNCSEWIGRFDGTEVKYDKDGEEVEDHGADIYISDGDGWGAVEQLIPAVRAGVGHWYDLNLENSGGGAHESTIEEAWDLAELVVKEGISKEVVENIHKFLEKEEGETGYALSIDGIGTAINKLNRKDFNNLFNNEFIRNIKDKSQLIRFLEFVKLPKKYYEEVMREYGVAKI